MEKGILIYSMALFFLSIVLSINVTLKVYKRMLRKNEKYYSILKEKLGLLHIPENARKISYLLKFIKLLTIMFMTMLINVILYSITLPFMNFETLDVNILMMVKQLTIGLFFVALSIWVYFRVLKWSSKKN